MPTTARVARIHEYGPPEVLRFEDIVVGEPGDDEALIRNTVIGLNFVDVYYRRGSLPVPAFPAIIGDEAAGVVEAVGKNVKNVSFVADPWEEKIAAHIQNLSRVTVGMVAKDALFIETARISMRDSYRIIDVLTSLGWTMTRSNGARWYKPRDSAA